jgi:hypothetical protein
MKRTVSLKPVTAESSTGGSVSTVAMVEPCGRRRFMIRGLCGDGIGAQDAM